MTPWIALGVVWAIALPFVVMSYLAYRAEIRWYEDFDQRNPGVAEKLGVKSRTGMEPDEASD